MNRPSVSSWRAVACLATAAAVAQGELEDAGSDGGAGGHGGGHGQGGQALQDRPGPGEVVDRPQGAGPDRLGARAQRSAEGCRYRGASPVGPPVGSGSVSV